MMGSDASLARRAISLVFCAVCALALWAMLASRFVPTAAGEAVALAAAVVFGAGFGLVAVVNPDFKPGSQGYQRAIARYPGLRMPISRALLGGLGGGCLAFLSVQGGALEFWTMAVGAPGKVVMHLGGYNRNTRHDCSGYDLREAPFMLRRVVCASVRYGQEAPPGTPVVLSGTVSPLGVDVMAFSIERTPPPASPNGPGAEAW
jgi:hypothetical protein